MNWINVGIALLPFVLLLGLIVGRRWSALKAMPLVWFITAVLGFFVWGIPARWIEAAFLKGFFISIEIILIIFGAVWLIFLLQEKKQIAVLHDFLGEISDDARIQVIVIAWLFGSLIEGISGFGVPAALTAPLLVSLGFAPFLAVVVSLIANSTSVSFGAAGTPILLGLGGLGLEGEFLREVTNHVVLFHSIGGLVVPLAMVYFVVRASGGRGLGKDFMSAVPFAIFSWLAFVIPYFLVARFIGPELPSIVAGIFGLVIVGVSAHFGFLVPKKKIRFGKEKKIKNVPWLKAIGALFPYVLITILLSLSRTIGSFKDWLSGISIGSKSILGVELGYSFLPLFTPSFYFIVCCLVCVFVYRASGREVVKTLKGSFDRVKYAFVALVFALALVQLLLISGNNTNGLESMPLVLAGLVSGLGKVFVFVTPFVGAFGSFMAGSNTLSNLLFGQFHLETALALGLTGAVVLALQVVGGAIGNMIAIHNVLAAESTVGLHGMEGAIIRRTVWVVLIYGLIVGLLGALVLFFI